MQLIHIRRKLIIHPLCNYTATCNSLHEMGLEPSLHDNSLKLLSTSGSWRDAWTYKTPVARPPNETPLTDNVIMKTIK